MNEAATLSFSWSGIASLGLVITNIASLIFLAYRCAYSSAERRHSKLPKETKDANTMRSLFPATKKICSTTSTILSSDSLNGLEETDSICDDDDNDTTTTMSTAKNKVVSCGYGAASVPARAPRQGEEELINESIIRFTTFLYSSRPNPQGNISARIGAATTMSRPNSAKAKKAKVKKAKVKKAKVKKANANDSVNTVDDTSIKDRIIKKEVEPEVELVDEKIIEHVKQFSLLLIKLVMKDQSEQNYFFHGIIDEKKDEYALKLKYDPPSIALAAILTAFESLSRDILPQIYRQHLVDEVFRIHKIDCTTPEVYEIRVNLRSLFHEMQEQRLKREVDVNTSSNE